MSDLIPCKSDIKSVKVKCVQIPFLLKVKYHGFWYEKEKELCPNPLSSKS